CGSATAARSARPISRWISWVRPPAPLRSRLVRLRVERGSSAYSAVIQPLPLPRSQGGTLASILAAHKTRVAPISIRADASAEGAAPVVIVSGRNWSLARLLKRDILVPFAAAWGLAKKELAQHVRDT